MKVIVPGDVEIDLGTVETTPTVGIIDYSRRVTDDFGTTTVVERGFARRMSVRFALPFDEVDEVQRQLAALRATPAQWIADEARSWLNFSGFYKDFELDLALPPLSYCTLTVEGLTETETVPDAGDDPAPEGSASTLLLVQPVTITPAMLTATNVPETDWPEWNAITVYPSGARVIKATTHKVYESLAATNVANDPAGLSGKWIEVGPTNRWAMFDQALGTATTRNDGIEITVAPGDVDALALLDVVGASVRVQKGAYDQTKPVVAGAITFLDLPGGAGSITVTIAGVGAVSVGTFLVGSLVALGITGESPTAGITDFSRKEVDDFGEATIVERAWSKRLSARSLIASAAVDIVANRIATIRAKPSLWIADDGTDSLTVYGFFKDFSIEVGDSVSTLSLSVEGLSEAMPIVEDFDGRSILEKNIYKRSASAPATPTGGSFDFDTMIATVPAGWSASVPAGSEPVYISSAIASKEGPGGSADFGAWSPPVVAFTHGDDGAPGAPGADGATLYTWYAYADAPNGTFNFATGAPGDRAYQGIATGKTTATESTNPADYDWSPYAGPPNFGLANFNANSVLAGSKLIKVAGGSAWNASVHSTESYRGGASVSFVVDALGLFMVGLNTDPTTDADFNSIDFAIYVQGGASVLVMEGGVNTASTGAATIGDVFTVTYNGKTVVYSRNGVPFHTNNAPPADLTLFLDSSLNAMGQSAHIQSFAAAGPAGAEGAPGAAGLNSAVVYLYRRGATSPATPTGTFTYTFATGVLSGGSLNGWTQAIPAADGNPLWVIAASASASTATDSIAAAEFSAPVLKDGAGLNAATVMLYQRAASAPAVPAGTLTYTFATGALSGTLGGWSQAVPAHNGNPLYLTTATAVGTSATDTIATGEWATPRVIATNGADGAAGAPGAPGADGTTLYTWYAYADAPNGTFNFTTGSPGDRTYQGVATGKTTATESVNPADYTWSPYVGPPNFGLAAFNSNTVVAGSKLIKVAGGSAWNASVHSTESYKGGASVSFVVDAIGLFMVGLNTDPTTDANYTSLDFAIYVQGGASVLVMEGGVNKASTGAAAIGDVFTVTYNGKSVVYSRNGVSFYTNSAPAANLTLFLDSSLNASGQSARILSFVAAGPAGADGAEGEPGLTISASPPVLTVARTAGGAPKAGELPKGTQVKVYDGTTDVTGSCSFAKADTGCSVSNGGGGAFSLTAISAEDAYTIVTATYGGRSIPIKIAVAQPRDGSAASRASASVTSMNATATYVAIATVDLVVPNGASVSGSASVTYLAASFVGGGTRTVRQQAKVSIQNLTDSGSEVDGTAQIGSAASYIGGDGPSDVGSVAASASVLNSTGATKTFRLRFYIRYYDGATTAQTAGGTFTGSIEAQAA